MSDSGQRTEQATPRRLQKAREEGRFPSSRHLIAGAQMLLFTALLSAHSDTWLDTLVRLTRTLIVYAFRPALYAPDLHLLLHEIVWSEVWTIASDLIWILIAGIAAQLVLTGGGLATSKIRPDLSRLNPMPRLAGMPSQNWSAFCESVVLLPVFLAIATFFVIDAIHTSATLPRLGVQAGFRQVASNIASLLWQVTGVFFAYGCFDAYRQRSRHRNDLRMTRQEVRDEHRESEGDPHVKARIRRLQRSAARRSMMKEVPKANAVIVNPTHYAVALQYTPGESAAPKVVAKGKNYLAARIRELAEANKVPIVENVPLAQALYKAVEVGQEIPPHLYRAVAEILAYIYRLSTGKP